MPCEGALFSCRVITQQMTAQSPTQTFTPNAASFFLYNNTNTNVTIAGGLVLSPGGTVCFPEMIDGCYNTGIPIGFANPAHTGQLQITAIIKVPL